MVSTYPRTPKHPLQILFFILSFAVALQCLSVTQQTLPSISFHQHWLLAVPGDAPAPSQDSIAAAKIPLAGRASALPREYYHLAPIELISQH